MAECPKCSTPIPEDAKFCPNCGQTIGGPEPEGYQPPPPPPVYQPPQQQYANYAPRMSQDAADNRYLCVFAYLSGLVLMPAVLKPNSPFVRFHVNQGLALLLFELMCGVVCIIPFLGWIVGGIGMIFAFVCVIIGIVHACNGEEKPLPIIGKWRILR